MGLATSQRHVAAKMNLGRRRIGKVFTWWSVK